MTWLLFYLVRAVYRSAKCAAVYTVGVTIFHKSLPTIILVGINLVLCAQVYHHFVCDCDAETMYSMNTVELWWYQSASKHCCR